jgi:hypothetical protein
MPPTLVVLVVVLIVLPVIGPFARVVNMQDENLTHLLSFSVLIVVLTALGLIAVYIASRRALAWV